MSNYWNRKIREAEPYVAGEQPKKGEKVIKLNTNENPYPPSPDVSKAIGEFDVASLRLYPDMTSTALRKAIASVEGVRPEQVFCGNGSDEVLALCFQTFYEKEYNTELPVLTPEYSYSFYPVFEKFYDVGQKKIPLREDFKLEPEDYIGVPNCGICIANPNAPTSRAIGLSDIKKICDANRENVVLIDEAYVAFKEDYETAVSLLGECPNLCVCRTFSKSHALAGLRVGYAIASEELIEGLRRAGDSFNSYPVGRLEQEIAAAAVKDTEYYDGIRRSIIETRKVVQTELASLGFEFPESSANFIFA